MVAYAELLALPMGALESVIEGEVEQNPALERAESSCPLCGEHGSPCGCRFPFAKDDRALHRTRPAGHRDH